MSEAIVNAGTIQCEKCNEYKFISDFKVKSKNYLRSYCNDCYSQMSNNDKLNKKPFGYYCEMCIYPGNEFIYMSENLKDMKEHIQNVHPGLKVCSVCKQLKTIDGNFRFDNKRKVYNSICIVCKRIRNKVLKRKVRAKKRESLHF